VTPPVVTPNSGCEVNRNASACAAASTIASACSWCTGDTSNVASPRCLAFCPIKTATPGTAASVGGVVSADPGSVSATTTQGANAAADPVQFPFTIVVIVVQTTNAQGAVNLALTITATGAGTLTTSQETYLRDLIKSQIASSLNVDPASVVVTLTKTSKRSLEATTANNYNGNVVVNPSAAAAPAPGSGAASVALSLVTVAFAVVLSRWM